MKKRSIITAIVVFITVQLLTIYVMWNINPGDYNVSIRLSAVILGIFFAAIAGFIE